MKEVYYSIRVVHATSEKTAIKAVQDGKFDESDDLCDKVVTKKELLRLLNGQKPEKNYVVEMPKPHPATLKSVISIDGLLATTL